MSTLISFLKSFSLEQFLARVPTRDWEPILKLANGMPFAVQSDGDGAEQFHWTILRLQSGEAVPLPVLVELFPEVFADCEGQRVNVYIERLGVETYAWTKKPMKGDTYWGRNGLKKGIKAIDELSGGDQGEILSIEIQPGGFIEVDVRYGIHPESPDSGWNTTIVLIDPDHQFNLGVYL